MPTLYLTEFSGALNKRFVSTPVLAEQTLAIGGSSVQSAAFNRATMMVRLAADSACSIRFGSDPVASPGNDMLLAANRVTYFTVAPGTKVAVVQAAAIAALTQAITQNTPGNSQAFPAGVPHSFDWYTGVNTVPNNVPPGTFTALTGWGQVYPIEGAPVYSNLSARIQIAKTQSWLKSTGGVWTQVQLQPADQVDGAHYVADFAGQAAIPWIRTILPDGSISVDTPPPGYNDHFFPVDRGTYTAGTAAGVFVQIDMKVDDPNMQLVGNVGADWWRDASIGFGDGTNNPAAGMSNWIKLQTYWQTFYFYSLSTAVLQANPPPPLL